MNRQFRARAKAAVLLLTFAASLLAAAPSTAQPVPSGPTRAALPQHIVIDKVFINIAPYGKPALGPNYGGLFGRMRDTNYVEGQRPHKYGAVIRRAKDGKVVYRTPTKLRQYVVYNLIYLDHDAIRVRQGIGPVDIQVEEFKGDRVVDTSNIVRFEPVYTKFPDLLGAKVDGAPYDGTRPLKAGSQVDLVYVGDQIEPNTVVTQVMVFTDPKNYYWRYKGPDAYLTCLNSFCPTDEVKKNGEHKYTFVKSDSQQLVVSFTIPEGFSGHELLIAAFGTQRDADGDGLQYPKGASYRFKIA